MLNIISVKGENFKSYKKFGFEIQEGLWVVKGNNKDDTASESNGSGKTTLFCDSIFWGLTGNTIEGLESEDDVVNFTTKKDCIVEVVFNDGKQNIKVTRTRKHSQFKNNLFLEVDGQSLSAHRVKDTQERIDQIIKVSPEIIKSTIIMSANISNKFSELTPKDRIALLESVRDYKIWSDFRDESKSSLTQYTNDICELNNDVISKQSQSSTIDGFIEKLSEDYKRESNTTEDEVTLESYKKQLEELQSVKEHSEEISKLEETIKEKKLLVEDVTNKHNEAVKSLNLLHKQSSAANLKLNTANNEVERLVKLITTDSICPTCGHKIEKTEEQLNKFKKSLMENKKISADALKEYNELEEEIKNSSLVEPEGLSDLRNDIANMEKQKTDFSYSDKSVKDKMLSLNSNITTLTDKIMSLNERLKGILETVKGYRKQKQTLEKEIVESSEKINAYKVEQDAYQFFYDSLGPKGTLRPYLLRKDITYLNKSLLYYSNRLYNNTTIKLTVPTIESNKIDIIVENANGMIKPVSSLSRGERKRLDLCIQFAIYDLVKSTAMFDTNILILDEIFDGLDVTGINNVISILEERTDSIPSIYVISHNPNAYSLIPKQITVTKVNDISRVDFKNVGESIEDVQTDDETGDK